MYISVAEIAVKWGVTPRQVQRLLADNRIPGAKKIGQRSWMIPSDAAKPTDPRFEGKSPETCLGFNYILDRTILPAPRDNPYAVLNTISEPRLRLPVEAEFAYLRGDFERVVECYRATEGDDASRLRSAPVTIAAAMSTGDYSLYLEVESFLKDIMEVSTNIGVTVFAELCLATAHTGAFVPGMAPGWLKNGDFSALHPKARPDAAYKRAKLFQCLGEYQSMLDIAQTALSFCDSDHSISFHEIYFRVACAIACIGLNRADDAERCLRDALAIALPHGFVTPFAESASAFGGLLERLLKQEDSKLYEVVMAQWERTFRNWLSFHNRFTKDNITLILTLREYEVAQAVARRVPYAKVAEMHSVSVSRLKALMEIVYGKLLISNRKELAKFVL